MYVCELVCFRLYYEIIISFNTSSSKYWKSSNTFVSRVNDLFDCYSVSAFFVLSEYFSTGDSKKHNDELRKQHGGTSSSHSNADLITNHLNETTTASKTATGVAQWVNGYSKLTE